ncbi:MAG: ABC transporter ATP-binding protein [Oscillospiraceae bacterium]|nr:ABC transporter ATP-binding protein [Oscillospiraceae bacterium]
MSKIDIDGLSFSYVQGRDRVEALTDIDLHVEAGECICLLGPSGCGKSTLLSILMGINRDFTGQIRIDGKLIDGPGPERAVVFQHYSLFPWLTARKNVMFGIRQSGRRITKAESIRLADEYLAKVGLRGSENKYPSQMSGGMQQRVAIARALALEADILLMDEPFGAIDPKLRSELQELVSTLSKEHERTVIFVTHDTDEAILIADRIVVMEPRRIRAVEKVTIPRPRKKDALVRTEEYLRLSKRLMSLFYERVADEIGNEEVVI